MEATLQAQSASAYLTVMQPSSLSISAAAASRSESGWDGVGPRPEDPRLDLNALELRIRQFLRPRRGGHLLPGRSEM
jgi:hypothetical protein